MRESANYVGSAQPLAVATETLATACDYPRIPSRSVEALRLAVLVKRAGDTAPTALLAQSLLSKS